MSALEIALRTIIQEELQKVLAPASADVAIPGKAPVGRPKKAATTEAAAAPAKAAITTKNLADLVVKIATGNRAGAVAVLTKHGVGKVSEIRPEQFAAVHADLLKTPLTPAPVEAAEPDLLS